MFLANGQELIDSGEYEQAVKEFSCLVDAQPTEVEGYRGRDRGAVAARSLFGCGARLYPHHRGCDPRPPRCTENYPRWLFRTFGCYTDSIPALTGESFAYWWFFKYSQAVHTINHLLEVQPENVYGNLFCGSSRLLQGNGAAKTKGMEDIEHAISLASGSADICFIVADAYTYGVPNPERAYSPKQTLPSSGDSTLLASTPFSAVRTMLSVT